MPLNSTIDGLDVLAGSSGVSVWFVVGIVFVCVVVLIFLLSRNFRAFVYGGVICGITLIIYAFSSWVGVSYVGGDVIPLRWVLYIFCFVIASILIGSLVSRLKFFKDFEKKYIAGDK